MVNQRDGELSVQRNFCPVLQGGSCDYHGRRAMALITINELRTEPDFTRDGEARVYFSDLFEWYGWDIPNVPTCALWPIHSFGGWSVLCLSDLHAYGQMRALLHKTKNPYSSGWLRPGVFVKVELFLVRLCRMIYMNPRQLYPKN